MEHRHLFVLCPPASGSTLAQRILATSPNVAAMPEEGQTYVPEILFIPERWNPALAIDWKEVRRSWEKVWDPAKPVRLEKSPPHLLRAGQLERAFAQAS